MNLRSSILFLFSAWILVPGAILLLAQQEPGRRVSIGPMALQIYCSGRGSPTTVVETGLGDFAFDWILVQQRVQRLSRICTYDRAGYGSSDAGTEPRTFAQLNLELHELLKAAGEKPPFILVGHSFGGGVIRNYAARYSDEVTGMILVESIAEHQPLIVGGKPVLLKEFAAGKSIPEPKLTSGPPPHTQTMDSNPQPLPHLYDVLPTELRELHQRFATQKSLEEAENSQREWSTEYYASWDRHPQRGLLGAKPLVVLTRAQSGYDPSPNYCLEQVDGQRLRAQVELLLLSSNSLQIVLPVGHNMHLEAPDAVAQAIREVQAAARNNTPLVKLGLRTKGGRSVR